MNSPTYEELIPFLPILLATPGDVDSTNYPLCEDISDCTKCIAYDNSGQPSMCKLRNLFDINGSYTDWIEVSNYSRSIFTSTEFPEYYI